MAPPQVNARLTRVTGATAATGGRDDWDAPGAEPAGAGAVKWTGSAGAYYRERILRDQGTGGANITLERELYLETALAREAGIDTDDVLVFIDPAGVETRARARLVARRELAGVPPSLQTTRIDLELV